MDAVELYITEILKTYFLHNKRSTTITIVPLDQNKPRRIHSKVTKRETSKRTKKMETYIHREPEHTVQKGGE